MCGTAGACRAVGNALNANCALYLVPCHRVIKSDGSSGGGLAQEQNGKNVVRVRGKNALTMFLTSFMVILAKRGM